MRSELDAKEAKTLVRIVWRPLLFACRDVARSWLTRIRDGLGPNPYDPNDEEAQCGTRSTRRELAPVELTGVTLEWHTPMYRLAVEQLDRTAELTQLLLPMLLLLDRHTVLELDVLASTDEVGGIAGTSPFSDRRGATPSERP